MMQTGKCGKLRTSSTLLLHPNWTTTFLALPPLRPLGLDPPTHFQFFPSPDFGTSSIATG